MSNAITNRSDLIYQLTVACELEQGLCLQYLFTAFSLKDDISEGLSLQELTFVRKWKANIFLIAAQEMLHLAQAGNLSAAVGGSIHLRRPNFPQSQTYYPTGLPWGLLPFSRQTMRLYACYERPVHIPHEIERLLGGCGFSDDEEAALFQENPATWRDKKPHSFLPSVYAAQRPRAVQHETIGELYDAIRQAFETLAPPSGKLIIGSPEAQIDGDLIDFPQVLQVLTREQGDEGIDLIIRQGEGCPADRIDSHFGVFVNIIREYDELKRNNPDFEPARHVHPNPLSQLHVDNTYPGWRLIHDPFTRDVNDLTTEIYEAMVLMLYRFFATTDELVQQQRVLTRTFLRIMTTIIKPLGEALTKLPMGDDCSTGSSRRPQYAGPSFEINRSIQLLPQMVSSWILLHERLQELTMATETLSNDPRAREPDHAAAIPYLKDAAVTMQSITEFFGAHVPTSESDLPA